MYQYKVFLIASLKGMTPSRHKQRTVSEQDLTVRLLTGTTCLQDKIDAIAKKMYGAASVQYSEEADKDIERYNRLGFGGLPICMAKTQYSFSGEAEKKGVPQGFDLLVSRVGASVGAGFLVPLIGLAHT